MGIRDALRKLLGGGSRPGSTASEQASTTPAADAPVPAVQSVKRYSATELGRPGFLRRSTVVHIGEAAMEGIFVGVYSKSEFRSFAEFVSFTMNISSITQDWYAYGDLKKAYEYYYPPDDDNSASWLASANSFSGSLCDLLDSLGHQCREHPHLDGLGGVQRWVGDHEGFGICGEGDEVYFEAYLADLT